MFPPSFFEHLSDRLELAVYDINAEYRDMGATSDIHARLGIDNLRVRFGDNRQFVTLTNPDGTETTVELDLSASDTEIARALNIQKINNITKPSETIMSNITGIQAGAFQSKLVEMRQKIADKQNEALTKIDGAVASGAAKMAAAVDDVVLKADKEVDAALHEFAEFTNGGPA